MDKRGCQTGGFSDGEERDARGEMGRKRVAEERLLASSTLNACVRKGQLAARCCRLRPSLSQAFKSEVGLAASPHILPAGQPQPAPAHLCIWQLMFPLARNDPP